MKRTSGCPNLSFLQAAVAVSTDEAVGFATVVLTTPPVGLAASSPYTRGLWAVCDGLDRPLMAGECTACPRPLHRDFRQSPRSQCRSREPALLPPRDPTL